jgi:nucleoside-diphosphate-sugar epimerase
MYHIPSVRYTLSTLNILIIGGSGFLSGALARAAVGRGHSVWILTRGNKTLPTGVTPLTADRYAREAFRKAVIAADSTWDLVVDCIAYEPGDIRQDLEVFPGWTDHLVFVSTDFVYDPAGRRYPQSEQSDHYLSEGYGGKKRECEILLEKAPRSRMHWTILRPGHIYGPGSELGCLPLHSRDPQLLATLRAGKPLSLAGGGFFLQQPVYAPDLASVILDLHGNESTFEKTFCVAGPDVVESREYYAIIARILGVALRVTEVPVDEQLHSSPESAPFLCHRFYDLTALAQTGIPLPATPMEQGLREHVHSITKNGGTTQ